MDRRGGDFSSRFGGVGLGTQKGTYFMMKKTVGIIVVMLLLFVSCSKEKTGWQGSIEVVDGVTVVNNPVHGLWDLDNEPKISIVQEKQIGMLDEGPDEFLFVYISDVAANSKGDIYVADSRLNEIRKFDKNGKYIMTLGRHGEGPGEFKAVTTLSINSRNELIAFDNMMGRVSVFSDSGDLVETTKKLMADSWIEPRQFYFFENLIIIFGKLNNSLKRLHAFDMDWNYLESFIEYQFVDNKKFEELSMVFQIGQSCFQDMSHFYYTKHLYDNQIQIYKNHELTKIIRRDSSIKKTYIVEEFSDRERAKQVQKEKGYQFAYYGRGVAFVGNSYQNSVGLYLLNSGHILHFVRKFMPDKTYEFGAELYNEEGQLLTYSKLGQDLFYEICCKDSNDIFYAIDRKEFNKVITFRLRINEK